MQKTIFKYILQFIKYSIIIIITIGLIAFIIMDILGNHYKVADGVYRSGQLNKYNLEYYIKHNKIQTILNLRGKWEDEKYLTEKKISKKYNVTHIDYTLWNNEFLDFNKTSQIVQILKDAKKPILIHCYGGADRTSLVAALYQFAIAKETPEEARKEFSILYGHTPYFRKKVIAMDKSFDNYIEHSIKAKVDE
jgi:protein tyrosine/serine phosphatase